MVEEMMRLQVFMLLLLIFFDGAVFVRPKEHWPEGLSDVEVFEFYAKRAPQRSGMYQDKTTTHKYQEIYGNHLLPFIRSRHAAGKGVKFMEIGLGCNMKNHFHYGAGVEIWKSLFSDKDELWFSEFNGRCIENGIAAGPLQGLNLLQGDQGNVMDLNRWVNTTKGEFNVIIDDGGHQGRQIMTSFYHLFDHALAEGGMYVIEDIHVNGFAPIDFRPQDEQLGIPAREGRTTLLDIIHSWVNEIIVPNQNWIHGVNGPPGYKGIEEKFFQQTYVPLPQTAKSLFVYPDACIIFKCAVGDVNKRCTYQNTHRGPASWNTTDATLRLRKWHRMQELKKKFLARAITNN